MRREENSRWEEVARTLRYRDRLLTGCYGSGLALAAACLFLPYHLSQTGAILLAVALVHMTFRIRAAHGAFSHLGSAPMPGPHPRLVLAESILFNVPFLVGANLLFMGIPLVQDRLQEALLDCWFLALTVCLLGGGYWWNQRVRRTLEFCVVGRAIPQSRSE